MNEGKARKWGSEEVTNPPRDLNAKLEGTFGNNLGGSGEN